MITVYKLIPLLILSIYLSFCNCDVSYLQTNVDGFMNAFDEAYSTEVIIPTTEEEKPMGNDVVETLEAATSKDYEESGGVKEEPVVTETVFHPGSEIKHEVDEDLIKMAARVVASISPDLELVNVTEAMSMVTDKVERSFSLRVARRNCEGDCSVACRVDLVSRGDEESVTWHNCLETNDVPRIKRGAVGGFKQVDQAEAQELAEIAAQTLDSIDADDAKRVVTQVIRAQKQLVNGIMYHLTLEMAQSDCKEDADKCQGKLSDYNICKILMQRLFSGESPHNAQVIKSECNPVAKAKEIENKKEKKRNKRLVAVGGTESNMIPDHDHTTSKKNSHRRLMGGKTWQDPNSDKIKEIAEFALAAIEKSSNSFNKQMIVRIVDSQSQVVAGVKYFLKMELVETDCRKGSSQESCSPLKDQNLQSCDVVVWDKPWEKFRSVTNVNCSPVNSRTRRALYGGKKPADVNDPQVKKIAEYAMAQLDAKSNSINSQKLIQIKKAETQLVSGTNYFLKLQLVETNCRKGSQDNNVCNGLPDKPVQECDVVVYDRPWDDHRQFISSKCESLTANVAGRNRRDVLGGLSPADVNSAEIKEMAAFAVGQLDAQSNSLNSQKLIKVKEASTQVVAGTNYYLKILLVETVCRKGSPSNSSCSSAKEKPIQECDVVVYDRSWNKHRELISSKCKPLTANTAARNKRDVPPGGLSPADVNSDEVKEMAVFALGQLDAQSNSINSRKLIKITEAKTQVVAGKNFYLKLQLVETVCRKGSASDSPCSSAKDKPIQECDVVVYDRPWDNHRELTSSTCRPLTANNAARNKRALYGGKKPADVNDPQVKKIAEYAMAQLDAKSNSINSQKLIQIKKAETQLVAGTNYFLKLQLVETNCPKGSQTNKVCDRLPDKPVQECDVVVYDRPWDDHREFISSKCESLTANVAGRNKREVPIGGNLPKEVDSDDVKDMAKFAVEDLNRKSNSMFKKSLVEVISAETQIVSGVNYHLKLRIVDTNCRKSGTDAENCSPNSDPNPQECDMTIWSQPWKNQRTVTKSNCKDAEDKKPPGGLREVDPLAPEVLEAARLSLKTIDRGSNSIYKHALIRVIDSKVQTVAGKKYFLTIEVGQSECTKSSNEENCSVKADNSVNDRCSVVVWDRPWLAQKEVLNANCGKRGERSVSASVDVNTLHVAMFEEFKKKYNKVYNSQEEHQKRFRIFRANLKKIKALQDTEQGTAVYGPNMFADLSEKEFKLKYTGLKAGAAPKPSNHHMVPAQIPDVELPVEFDWRDHGAVTPVKNQGMCGSCWAFSVTGNVEGQWFLKHGQLLSLSEQELVDCDKRDDGCMGGYMTQAYEAIEDLGGLETEDEYPYEAEHETCKFNKSEARATVASSLNITTNETQIAQWLFKNGPISIGINANAMQFYMGGVSHPFKFLCSKNQLDHGVLLVGFGVHKSLIRHKMLPYWLIKNSWGPHWGEKGYYRVYRGDGTCGVNQMCSSAVVG